VQILLLEGFSLAGFPGTGVKAKMKGEF